MPTYIRWDKKEHRAQNLSPHPGGPTSEHTLQHSMMQDSSISPTKTPRSRINNAISNTNARRYFSFSIEYTLLGESTADFFVSFLRLPSFVKLAKTHTLTNLIGHTIQQNCRYGHYSRAVLQSFVWLEILWVFNSRHTIIKTVQLWKLEVASNWCLECLFFATPSCQE